MVPPVLENAGAMINDADDRVNAAADHALLIAAGTGSAIASP
jgi:hypothetical protein